jgi:hypothetical protein
MYNPIIPTKEFKMKSISQKSINNLKPILAEEIIALEFKKNAAVNIFSENSIDFIQAPINNTINSIKKFLIIIENPVTSKNITQIELNDYIEISRTLDEKIKNIYGLINSAQLFKAADVKSFALIFDKVNSITDSKMEFEIMYNKAKWPKN